MNIIRKAREEDISRICEILIFTKRAAYRSIFKNDHVSFNVMKVSTLMDEYYHNIDILKYYYVYDDGIVKGLIHIEGKEVKELYVDSFFHRQGIGQTLMDFAIKSFDVNQLWVLEKNINAIHFYQKNGFIKNGEKVLEEGTTEYLNKMIRI